MAYFKFVGKPLDPYSERTIIDINNFEGDFPDLSEFNFARRIFIINCKLIVYKHTPPIPDWIESIWIQSTEINELPRLPMINLTRISICKTNLSVLPDYLSNDLIEFKIEYAPNIDKLPTLPHKLTRLTCVETSVVELPPLPEKLIKLYCWNNKLIRLPQIPYYLNDLRCKGNPFSEMSWINELHENGNYDNLIKISPVKIKTVLRVQEVYYAVRFRNKFKRWLWIHREREAMRVMNPVRLAEFIQDATPENMESTLDQFYSLYVKSS